MKTDHAPTPKLYIRLRPGRRFACKFWRGVDGKPSRGTVLAHFTGSDGWDWYRVRFDVLPDLIHARRRDGLTPLKADYKPLYEAAA